MSMMKNYIDSIDASESIAEEFKKCGVELDEKAITTIRDLLAYVSNRVDFYESLFSKENESHVDENVIIQRAMAMGIRDLILVCSNKHSCIENVMSIMNTIKDKCHDSEGAVDEEIIKLMDGLILLCGEGLSIDFND